MSKKQKSNNTRTDKTPDSDDEYDVGYAKLYFVFIERSGADAVLPANLYRLESRIPAPLSYQ